MKLNIQDFGDGLERKVHDLISTRLPKYKLFWSKYVGNINGKPMSIEKIPEHLNSKRLFIAQWNYTILRNTYSIDLLYKKNTKKRSRSILNIISQQNDFILATHLFYNSIELINKINIHLEINSTIEINGFKDFRNNITHNVFPLTKIKNKNFQVPFNFAWFSEISIKNNESWIWSETDFSKIQFEPLHVFLNFCYEKTISYFNKTLKDELDYFELAFAGLEINGIDTSIHVESLDTASLSGM